MHNHSPTTRRDFIRSSAVTLTIGGVALAACSTDHETPDAKTQAGTPGGAPAQNANSKLDTALKHGPAQNTSASAVSPTAQAAVFQRYAPTLPPLSSERTLRLDWHAREVPIRI